MTDRGILRWVDAFAGLEVVVIGDVILDGYLDGHTERLCREAPVPVVSLRAESYVPGGAGNAAANLAALGANVTLLSVVGEDANAAGLRTALRDAGVPPHGLVPDPARETLAKRRLMADGQMVARVDQGTATPIEGEAERALVERLEGAYQRCDAVLVSDYACGVVTPAVAGALARLRARAGSRPPAVAVDAKRPELYASLAPSLAKPNFGEALAMLERAGERIPSFAHGRSAALAQLAPVFLRETGAETVILTLDSEGALVMRHDSETIALPCAPCEQAYPSGAGDALLAAATLALAAGAAVLPAARIGMAAAAVSVRKAGTAPCRMEDLEELAGGADKFAADVRRLAGRLGEARSAGRRVVFTNGCFDILHRGHIEYLDRAKRLGDILVVGMNTDESVRRIKGPSRPVNSLSERVHVLAALSSVDHIVAFGEDTADALLAELRPDVFAKGGDYLPETVPEAAVAAALGIELVIVPLVEDRSTSGLIERIRASAQGGRE